jgi:hypothetical protein
MGLLKLGIVGFVLFVWFSCIFVKRGIKYWDEVEDEFLKGVVLGSICSFLGFGVSNVASPNFMQNSEVAVFGLCFGINEVIYRAGGLSSKSEASIN